MNIDVSKYSTAEIMGALSLFEIQDYAIKDKVLEADEGVYRLLVQGGFDVEPALG